MERERTRRRRRRMDTLFYEKINFTWILLHYLSIRHGDRVCPACYGCGSERIDKARYQVQEAPGCFCYAHRSLCSHSCWMCCCPCVCVYTGSNGNLRLDQQTLSTSSEGGENSEGEWAISRGHLTLMVPAADGRTGGGRSRRSLSIYSHAKAGGTTIDRRSFLPH